VKVKVKIGGSLKRNFGKGEMVVDLPSKSTLGDLFEKINNNAKAELREKFGMGSFQQIPMIIMVGDRDHRFIGGFEAFLDENTPVYLFSVGVGG